MASAVGSDLAHPLTSNFAALASASGERELLLDLIERGAASIVQLNAEHGLEIAEALAALGLENEAYELTTRIAAAEDPAVARWRARCAMRLGRYEAAIAAADVAIAALLHIGLSVEEFVRLSARGAAAEGLLRFERGAVARIGHLHEPIAIRWEALRRSGRMREASLMRTLCIRHFADRASVWATAGNHALDDADFDSAERYFDQCLQLDHAWTAALAGKAIVLETRKLWSQALEYRERVVQVESSLGREDAPSLQRVIRYAAALGRVGRWDEAGVLLRQCVRLGAFAALPAERSVLLRVFSRELYSPALIAAMLPQPIAAGTLDEPLRFALHEARVFAHAYAAIHGRQAELEAHEWRLSLGICAWLAGDDAHAFALLDEAELDREGDLTTQYFLLSTAAAIGASELPSIKRFAEQAARAVVAQMAASADQDAFYALLILKQLGCDEPLASSASAPAGSFVALYNAASGGANAPCPELPLPDVHMSMAEQLQRLAAFRAAQRAAQRPVLDAALASAQAAASLVSD
jgi:tetratricopeptide (TPR) repeat protein